MKTTVKMNRKIKLKKLIVYCPYLDKDVGIEIFDFSGSSGDCDLCGSHGDVEVSFSCECERNHEIEVSSW